ncbi:MAG: YciK family oxidoreductase [Pseudomonadales bacterium]|nr:YciK family oxidoreductase [Pseudomonadales bacterium]NIX06556.1 YciK family oxidoreductase [Pseudomonadales bacterium]
MPKSPDYPELETARSGWRFQPDDDCLRGKAVLVTGAGDGIGAAAAKTYACYGADVILLGRTRPKLESVFDWIEAETDTRPVIVPCELRALDDASADALHDAIAEGYGRLDGILHCASALGPKVPIAHYPTAAWQEVLQVNATAPFLLTRTLLPLLNAVPAASVVLVSSTVGRQGRAYWGAYAVSKHALEGLMEVLADEHEHAGIVRINSLNPGATRTAMRAAAYPAEDPAKVPTPEERMDIFVYLMADASSSVSGEALDARDWAGR